MSARSRVVKMGSKGCSIELSYLPNGAIKSQTYLIEGARYVYETEWGYSGSSKASAEFGSREVSTTLPDGEKWMRRFDASGMPQALSAQGGHEVASSPILRAQKLNRYGQLEWRDIGDGTREHSVYDAFRRLKYAITKRQADNETLQAFGYGYDRVQRVTSVSDYCTWLNAAVVCCDPQLSSCSPQENSETYSYDSSGQLTLADSTLRQEPFRANAIGNLVQKGNTTLKYEDGLHPHAATSASLTDGNTTRYAYNRVGQMLKMDEEQGSTEFTWNANGMPIRITKGADISERRYMGETLYKRRDVNSEGETTTLYLPRLRVENGKFRKNYEGLAEREPSDGTTSGALRFFHSNHLGSSTLITDESGLVVHRSVFAPYGETRSSEGAYTPFQQFTGQEKMASGLYDYGARLYHPKLGRFISADSEIDGLNPYSYVRNNPMTYVDPTGHFKESAKKVKAEEDLVYDLSTDTWRRKGEPSGQHFVNSEIRPNDGPPRLTDSTKTVLALGEFSRSETAKIMEAYGYSVLMLSTGEVGTLAGVSSDILEAVADPDLGAKVKANLAACLGKAPNPECNFLFIAAMGAKKNKFGVIFRLAYIESKINPSVNAAKALKGNNEVQVHIDRVVDGLRRGIEPESVAVMDASRRFVPGLREAHAGRHGRVIYSVEKDASGKVTHVDIWAKYDVSPFKHGKGYTSLEQSNFFNSIVNAYHASK